MNLASGPSEKGEKVNEREPNVDETRKVTTIYYGTGKLNRTELSQSDMIAFSIREKRNVVNSRCLCIIRHILDDKR